jgi:hypothetical protein
MELHAALVFAATLPNDDYAGFLLSTSVLLADRLQGGLGTDDLFWHWDAFRAHYRIAEVVPRVTIMQGFRRANINGRVALFDPPELFELTSYSHDETLGKLAAVDPEFAAFGKLIAQSLSDPGAYRNEGMRHAHAAVSGKVPAAITLGIRAIYETIDTWDPEPDLTFDPSGPLPVMLPGPGA